MSEPTASMATRLTAALRGDIIAGALAPGTRLTEKLLSQRYEVSRIPVREALRALEAVGLVETRPYAGSTVARAPLEDAEDLFEIRIVLETSTARRAASRAAAQLAAGEPDAEWWAVRREVSEVLDAGDAAIAAGDPAPLAELNVRFHALVARLSDSSSLQALLRQISGRIEWLYAVTVTTRGRAAWAEHRTILRAIDGGAVEEAAALMGAHVQRSRDSYFAHLAATARAADAHPGDGGA